VQKPPGSTSATVQGLREGSFALLGVLVVVIASLSGAPLGPIFFVSIFSGFVGPEHVEFARELPQIYVMGDDPAASIDDKKIADTVAR
jgi:hypothetical protein